MTDHRDDRDEQRRRALLRIRTRYTVGARHSASETTVRCPRRETSLSTAECLACGHAAGIARDANATYLVCTDPAAQRAALSELMREPLFQSAAARTPLWTVMTAEVVCVAPDLELAELAALFSDRNISGAPVVDAAGRPLGVVSRTDLMQRLVEEERAWAEGEAARTRWPRGSIDPSGGMRASDVMMPIVFALPESSSLAQAAALMAYEGVHRIPVVSSEGRVVGLVSSLDVARWLAEQDGLIEPETAPPVRSERDRGE